MTATYTTEAKRTQTEAPAGMTRWTADKIVEYGKTHYRWNFDGEGRQTVPANKFTAFLGDVSDTFFSTDHWKNSFYARFPQDAQGRYITEWVKAAIIWYHGATPIVTPIGVHSHGYAC